MPQAFLPSPNPFPTTMTALSAFNFSALDQRWNRVILIGEHQWVLNAIHQLHVLGFAAVSDWAHPVPTQNPGESIAVLKRPRI